MSKNLYMLKKWWRNSCTDKKLFAYQIFAKVAHAILYVIAPIFSAKVVSNLTIGNYDMALINLSIVFVMLVFRNLIAQWSYRNYGNLTGSSYLALQKKMINKIIDAKSENFIKNKKEKLLNIYHSSAYNVSVFSDTLSIAISKLLRLVITLVIVATINIYVALLLLAVDIINYFIVNFLYARISATNKSIDALRDIQNEKFGDMFDNKDVMDEMRMRKKAEQRYMSFSKKLSAKYGTKSIQQGHIDNLYFVYYSFVVFVITFFMIIILSKGSLTLENYLVIVPYLTTGITDANEFFDLFVKLKNVDNSVNRLRTVLEFSPKDMQEFGKNNCDDITGEIDFYNVSFKSPRNATEKLPQLKNVNFHIEENENTLILGNRGCGKRTIFYLLRRLISPDNGNVYISGVNAKEYTHNVYSKNFSFCTSKPTFMRGSILKNLKLVETDTKLIYETCKKLGIYDNIMQTPHKFSTDPTDMPNDVQYLIGLARALLTKSEIIVLYEFPNSLSINQKNRIADALLALKDERTIITFSANDFCIKFSNKIIEIDDGEVKGIHFNKI